MLYKQHNYVVSVQQINYKYLISADLVMKFLSVNIPEKRKWRIGFLKADLKIFKCYLQNVN